MGYTFGRNEPITSVQGALAILGIPDSYSSVGLNTPLNATISLRGMRTWPHRKASNQNHPAKLKYSVSRSITFRDLSMTNAEGMTKRIDQGFFAAREHGVILLRHCKQRKFPLKPYLE